MLPATAVELVSFHEGFDCNYSNSSSGNNNNDNDDNKFCDSWFNS